MLHELCDLHCLQLLFNYSFPVLIPSPRSQSPVHFLPLVVQKSKGGFIYRSDISIEKMVEKAKLCVDALRLRTMDLVRPLADGFAGNCGTIWMW